jgi:hypothetical protein
MGLEHIARDGGGVHVERERAEVLDDDEIGPRERRSERS